MKRIIIIASLLLPVVVLAQEKDSIVPVHHKESMRQFYVWANEHLSAKDTLEGCSACKVTVTARVNPEGKFDTLWVSQSVNARLDANALRVMKLSEGKWLPGKRNDTLVTAEVEVPIDFKVKNGYDAAVKDTIVHILNGVIYRDAYFKGGKHAMTKFIADRIKYPQGCREYRIEGEVVVAFTIDRQGMVKGAYAATKVHEQLDVEAIRVVNMMSGYVKPRTVNGMPYESIFEVAINFNLPK